MIGGYAVKLYRLRRTLYKAARTLGDVQAVTSGKPGRIGRRVLNKGLGRALGRLFLR